MSRFRNEINSIIKDLQSGRTDRWQDLYNFTFNHLKVIALCYAENKDDWEDILNEAYLRIFKYIQTADLKKDGYNWLCKIVQNVAFDFSQKVQSSNYDANFSFLEIEKDIIEKDALLMEISKLSKEDRRLLCLRYWENKTYREIARVLKMSKSVAHKRITILTNILEEKLK